MGSSNQFDDTLTQLGTGKWNLLLIVSIMYWTMQLPCMFLGGSFLAPQVDHSCLLPEGAIPLLTNHSNTTQVSSCEYLMVGEDDSEEIRPCTRWIFDNSTFYSTLTSEFELVCDYKSLRPTYTGIYFIGACLSSSISGWLSDKYGRKRMMVIGAITYAVVGNCLSWLHNMSSILVFRFIVGLMHPMALHTAYTIVIETTEPRLRSVMGIMIFLPWAIAVMIWGAMGYLFRDWRWLMLVSTVPSLLFLPTLWFMDESPRWLIVQGQHDRAMKVLEKAARWNKATLPPRDQLLTMMQNIASENSKVSSGMKSEGFVSFLRTFVGEFTVLLSGLMEIPGATVTVPMIQYLGRRLSNIICLLMTGISLLALAIVPLNIGWLVMTLAMIGKMAISAANQIIHLHSSELFPTEVRDRGLGTSEMMAKLGSTLAPYLMDTLRTVWVSAPSVVCGVTGLLAAGVTFTLPETTNTALLDTVEALEETSSLSRKRNASSSPLHKQEDHVNTEEKIPLA
ncbi:organic cation transporter protein-like isoform X2 [Homarus americanus]|uniref:organic cation transporter protein-like isoform X2 n=1 Tax=Homarus americanus TaxID=6706 RepID=UPI001C44E0B1|nr:organic cation transporter protein-like isoform X2 [Homarus americanus]